ncbi:SusC/RagA family TonB-linked outer membrane protein [Pedobacter frigidisoli]|uniref:SusC/RagA family TonB-linked outer membrane protein n=1 Tax=Pedobacter frigidisoli TaxID=2530455 RepID=UPI002931773E|nr:SusC/RagA family TonB-linked outer membrane protein [Pedobacter frigidisoli]
MQLILPKKGYPASGASRGNGSPIIRLVIAIFCIIVIQGLGSRINAQTVTLNVKHATLESVIKQIGSQTGYEVFYRKDQLKNTKTISKTFTKAELNSVLEAVFLDQPVRYVITNKTIVVTPRSIQPEKNEDKPINVSGKVSTIKGDPYPGLAVQVVNTNNIVVTDANGYYMLKNVDPLSTIRVNGLTIQTTYTYVQGKTNLDITVSEKVNQLDEVVINKGYYTESEILSTGKSIMVSGDDIRKTPSTNPILGLQGRVPGLYIETSSGLPGAMQQVTIRGRNSINNAIEPLYIINGVPYNSSTLSFVGSNKQNGSSMGLNPLAALNPNDIEEITILKDADATAIYGSRGANGVVLITTKKGKIGATVTSVDYSHSISAYPKFVDMLNTQQYLEMRKEAYRNDGANIQSSDYDLTTWDQNKFTDWQKELLGNNASINNLQASISGGNQDTQFIINGGYRTQSLIFNSGDGLGDKTASLRTSITHTSNNKKLSLTAEISYINNNNLLPLNDPTTSILRMAPNAPDLYTEDGKINFENNTFNSNPAINLVRTVKSVTDNLLGNFRLSYKITPDLYFTSNFNYNKVQLNELGKNPFAAISPDDQYSSASVNVGKSDSKSWIAEPQINYNKKLGNGNFSALIGSTFQQTRSTGSAFMAQGFLSDAQLDNYSSAQTKSFTSQRYADYHYLAFYTRLNYVYKEKYIINLTGRRDGSSRFGPDRQYGNFGSAGLAWLISNEEFAKKFTWLSLGKLRVNYGITGNDKIDDYNILTTYETSNNTLYGNVSGLVPTRLANPETAWESNHKIGLGIDLGFINNRLNLSVDYFRNRSGNQLVSTTLPSYLGYENILENLPAVVQNQGLEIVLNTINLKSSKVNWSTNINLSFLKNKLISFPSLDQSVYASFYRIGEPLSARNLYHYTGLNPQTGLYTFEDTNKDGVINYLDQTAIKNISPSYYGGLTNTVSYKNFQLDVLISFVKQTQRAYLANYGASGSFSNSPVMVLDRWQKPGDNSVVQRFTTGAFFANATTNFFNYVNSDASVVDGSYIRLKNINLSYTFPQEWLNKFSIKGLQIYGNIDNVLVITPYASPDPEVTGPGMPPLRTISMGIRVSL